MGEEAPLVELALFPLHTVLFPGGTLALKIFETRYVDLIARCLREGDAFGVVAITSGAEVGEASTYSVGTLAEIADWRQLPGGLLGVTAAGGRRFRVSDVRRQPDGLYVGGAVVWAEEPPCALPESARGYAELLRRAFAELGRGGEGEPDGFADARWVSWRLAETLPISLPVKQELLETESALARLARLGASSGIS